MTIKREGCQLKYLSILFLIVFAAPAHANKLEYCKALAQDFADARSVDETSFQHKYNISYRACMGEPQVMKKKSLPTKKTTAAGPLGLVPGSNDWNIFCANKYASFNPATGTYKSYTGVERKCVVSLN
jgi:BA14K-like protein